AAFLHNLCTNEIKRLAVGRGCEAFLTTSQAKTVALARVFRPEPERFCLDTGRTEGAVIARHFDHFLVSEDVVLRDGSEELAQIHLTGRSSRRALGSIAEVANDAPELSVHQAEWRSTRFEIRMRSRLGTGGIDVIAEPSVAGSLWEAMKSAGAVPA